VVAGEIQRRIKANQAKSSRNRLEQMRPNFLPIDPKPQHATRALVLGYEMGLSILGGFHHNAISH
jgi:hypothetical protein